ncbi:MAG: class B sortase [Oscillospiraceae bacterium]|nr:class B sortase [Oscillospiraceae bacterium]
MKKKTGIWFTVGITVLVIAGIIFGYLFAADMINRRKDVKNFEELQAIVSDIEAAEAGKTGMENTESGEKTPEEPENIKPVPLAKYAPLFEQNNDFFGWLKIEDTVIDYPVMFTPDRVQYYIHRDFLGNDSFSGVPFMDERWHEGAGISIIYGHHMANGTMFGSLPLYSSQEYRDKHPIIEFDTRFEEREFEVMAVFLTEIYPDEAKDVFKYYDYADLSDEKDFDEFIKGVKALELYDTGVEAHYGDELLVLSTCNYHTEAGRLVVVGKQIKQ